MPPLTPSRARRSPGAGARAVLAARRSRSPATKPGEAWDRAKRLARERARADPAVQGSPSPAKVAGAARRAQGLAGRFHKAASDDDDASGPPATPALRRSPLAAANTASPATRPASPALAPGLLTERRRADEARRVARAAAILNGDAAPRDDANEAQRARWTAAATATPTEPHPRTPSSLASAATPVTAARITALEGTETRLLAALDAAALAARDRLDASERERSRTLDAEQALNEANALVETLRAERDALREAHGCSAASTSSSTATAQKLEAKLDTALKALWTADRKACDGDATIDALKAEMAQLRAAAAHDRTEARDAAEHARRARLDVDRAVAAAQDAAADARSAKADAAADRQSCRALEAQCRLLGASDAAIAAARAPRPSVLARVRAHREVCGLACALAVLADPSPWRVGLGLGALGALAVV